MNRKTGLILLFVILFSFTLSSARVNGQSPQNDGGQKIALELQASMDTLAPGEMVTAIVTLADQADLSTVSAESHAGHQGEVVLTLQAKSRASQRAILALLGVRGAQGKVSQVTEFWVFNGLSVTGTADVFQELAAQPEVAGITPDAIDVVPTAPLAAQPPETNLSVVNAPESRRSGFSRSSRAASVKTACSG